MRKIWKKKFLFWKKNFGSKTDTEIGPWFWFPILKLGFGCTLHRTIAILHSRLNLNSKVMASLLCKKKPIIVSVNFRSKYVQSKVLTFRGAPFRGAPFRVTLTGSLHLIFWVLVSVQNSTRTKFNKCKSQNVQQIHFILNTWGKTCMFRTWLIHQGIPLVSKILINFQS